MTYRLTAKAVVRNENGEIEITPDAMEYDSIPDALGGFRQWADGGFWPAASPVASVSLTIDRVEKEQ